MAKERLETLPSLLIPLNTHQIIVSNPSSLSSMPILPARPLSPGKRSFVPRDSTAFLTALAGQERRVLELREELRNAEIGLESLKQQWAMHETSKELSGIQQLGQLQHINKPMHNAKPINSDEHVRVFKDQERRRAMLMTTKNPQRKVFSGSRHTRTLSLLSPISVNNQTMPILPTVEAKGPRIAENRLSVSDSLLENSFSSASTQRNPSSSNRYPPHELPRDAILETGKQLVGDLREGLWTFFEDLKQATVGDEATGNLVPRKPSPVRSKQLARNQMSNYNGGKSVKNTANSKGARLEPADNHLTKTNPNSKTQGCQYSCTSTEMTPLNNDLPATQSASGQTSLQQLQGETPNTADSDDDGWNNWDSPKPKDLPTRWSTGSATSDSIASMSSPLTDQSSARNSTR